MTDWKRSGNSAKSYITFKFVSSATSKVTMVKVLDEAAQLTDIQETSTKVVKLYSYFR